MTWATLAAAVACALLLAAVESLSAGRAGTIGHPMAGEISAPNGGARGRPEVPLRSKRERDEPTRRSSAPQQH